MNVREEATQPLNPRTLVAAADKFIKYGSAGLAAQGDLSAVEAERLLLAAIVRRLVAGYEPGVAGDELVEQVTAALAAGKGLCRAEAGRALLSAVSRWWGIDFPREVDDLQREEE